MKIVYLYHSLSIHGGIERVIADKMNYPAENSDNDIFFITCDQNNDLFSYQLSDKIKHCDLDCIRYHSIYKSPYPMRLWKIREFEKEYKKHLLAKLNEIKPDILIANTSFCPLLIGSLDVKCKKILESHIAFPFILKAGSKHSNLNKFEYFLKSIYDIYFCKEIKKYDELVVLTQDDVNYWKKYKKAVLIPNPITLYPDSIMHSCNKSIIAVGRLYGQKGFDLLIEAWGLIHTKYPDWRVNIYGDGNDRKILEDKIKEYNIESSFFIHHAVDTIYDKYQESEFLVMSSRAEGFGLVLAEAMSCGIPCVSFNCPSGPSEIITDGVDGLLAENGNVKELADKICIMIENEVMRKDMGQKARINSQRYKKEIIMQQWIDLFKEVIYKHK